MTSTINPPTSHHGSPLATGRWKGCKVQTTPFYLISATKTSSTMSKGGVHQAQERNQCRFASITFGPDTYDTQGPGGIADQKSTAKQFTINTADIKAKSNGLGWNGDTLEGIDPRWLQSGHWRHRRQALDDGLRRGTQPRRFPLSPQHQRTETTTITRNCSAIGNRSCSSNGLSQALQTKD